MTDRPILLIDDNLLFLDKLKHLAEAAGYSPKTVMFATAIDSALSARPPAAVVVNLDADRMDALAIIAELRGPRGLTETPILGYAGHVKVDLLDRGKAAGATHVVTNGEIASRLGHLLDELCTAKD